LSGALLKPSLPAQSSLSVHALLPIQLQIKSADPKRKSYEVVQCDIQRDSMACSDRPVYSTVWAYVHGAKTIRDGVWCVWLTCVTGVDQDLDAGLQHGREHLHKHAHDRA
jgi:hypothetical protein